MNITDDNLLTLSDYLSRTLSPNAEIRRPAEKLLESIELNQNFPILLLHLIGKKEVDMTIRIAGAIAFKNYIKRNWEIGEDSNNRICDQDRVTVKKLIVDMMLQSPESIQKQLSDAVSIIGKHDFPNLWPELLDQMIEKFNTGDFHIINGVLHTAHSLFKRYRYEFKSEALWREIKYVLDKFAKPLTDLFLITMNLTQTHANNIDVLKVVYSSLNIICKIFYSLNFQDLPEFFEDNMASWMSNFHTLLNCNVPALQDPKSDDMGIMENLKTQVCDNVCLYASKYDEEFQPFLPEFVEDIWKLLTTTSQQTKYDALVSNALQFLAIVADKNQYKSLFENPATLSNICENVIIPNMEFRESDNELFEDNPEEYIRRDIEGSDVDTRRRAACDLVKSLSKSFEAKIIEIFGTFIQGMLQNYAQKPLENWRSKDAAIYLVTSCTSKGQTQRHGVVHSSEFVSIPDFATNHIEPELCKPDVNELPVLKADAIKFLMTFRSILPKDQIIKNLPQIIRHLSSNNVVVNSYAACAIEKILALTGPNKAPMITGSEIAPLASTLLTNLFTALETQGGEENEYIMKAIMRTFATLQELIVPYLADLLPKLTDKVVALAKNPSRPNFNHYLFETLSLSIKIVCKTTPNAVASFEQALFPTFQAILQQDIQEFVPYVFQILALLFEMQPDPSIPESYKVLFPCLLSPVLFERKENIHPLNRLLVAYVTHGLHEIIKDEINGLLGVFQKLIASKVNDHEGFLLIQSIIEYFPSAMLEPYINQIFILLFQRLTSSKTAKYVKGLIIFFASYSIKYGAHSLVTVIDSIQPQMFGMVIERILVTDMQKITGAIDRKITAVGITNLLTDCQKMLENPYNMLLPKLLNSLIEFFECPVNDEEVKEDEQVLEIDSLLSGYQAAYNQLIFARSAKRDPLPNIQDARVYFACGLKRLPQEHLQNLIGQIPEQSAMHLKNYLHSVG